MGCGIGDRLRPRLFGVQSSLGQMPLSDGVENDGEGGGALVEDLVIV